MKLQSWQQFFMAQGLFFLGLGMGILGETWNKRTHLVSWVLLGVGVGSLALCLLLWALQTQRTFRKRIRLSKLPPPVSVNQNFNNLLKGNGAADLMRGYYFSTECRILLSSKEKYIIDANSEWIVHHLEGTEVHLTITPASGTSTVDLKPGEMVRIPLFHQERDLVIEEAEDTQGQQDRAPRLILHKVACRNLI